MYDDEHGCCPGPADGIRKPDVRKDPVTYRMSLIELRRVTGITEPGKLALSVKDDFMVVRVIP